MSPFPEGQPPPLPRKTGRAVPVLSVLVVLLGFACLFEGYVIYRLARQPSGTTASLLRQLDALQAAATDADGLLDSWPDASLDAGELMRQMEERIRRMEKQMDDEFDADSAQALQQIQALRSTSHHQTSVTARIIVPSVDLREEGDRYVVRLGVPDPDRTRFDIQVRGSELRVTGKLDGPPGTAASRFERSVTLPGPGRQDGLSVKVENGALVLSIPKG